MLRDMNEQQEAVFRMAFKMHNTTNYQIIGTDSAEKPDLVLVDTDTADGIETWKTLKTEYSDIPVADVLLTRTFPWKRHISLNRSNLIPCFLY